MALVSGETTILVRKSVGSNPTVIKLHFYIFLTFVFASFSIFGSFDIANAEDKRGR